MASPQAQENRTPSPLSSTSPNSPNNDPFASQRKDPVGNSPFASKQPQQPLDIPSSPSGLNTHDTHQQQSSPHQDRRVSSDEWDASKTPPSRFQKRKGSIYATPGSRDGHVDKHTDRDAVFHAKHAEKGYGSIFGIGGKGARRSSKGGEV